MKFSASLSAALFSTAVLAGTVAPRQLKTVQGVLSDVSSDITSLDGAVKKYNGGDSSPVVDAANTLVGTIDDGDKTVKASDDLSLADALGLQDPVKALTDKASTLVDDLKSKRDAIAKAGECKTTRGLISKINTSSNTLVDTVVSKVPKDAQSIADGLAADLRKVLKQAQEDFSEANCVDSDNGGSKPTSKPSDKPTDKPTGKPTAEPTAEPTSEPAGEPTAEPTGEPSGEPTGSPTEAPTGITTPPPSGGNGGNGTSPEQPIPTAGAAALIPAGALAFGFAALLM